MRHHHDRDPHDALNDYLDSLAGAPPPNSRAEGLDPGLRAGVDRFFDLAERAGMTPGTSRRPTVNAPLPASTALAPPNRKPRRNATLPAWTQHLHLVWTGLLIVAVIALTFAAFGPNGIRNGGNDSNGTGDGPSLNGAVPIVTVPDDAETTTIHYPTADECTVEPMTRNEMIAHIQEANVATAPNHDQYERPIEPTAEEAQAIMQVFDVWQACGLDTPNTGLTYQLQLQTPWFSANQLGVFWNFEQQGMVRPVSEADIEAYVDLNLTEATPVAVIGSPPALPERGVPNMVPIPPGSTPVVYDGGPTIFAEDIVITGPNTARVQLTAVDEKTREVVPSTPITYGFVRVDGQWLIDSYQEGTPG